MRTVVESRVSSVVALFSFKEGYMINFAKNFIQLAGRIDPVRLGKSLEKAGENVKPNLKLARKL